jgi:hypothetical protein
VGDGVAEGPCAWRAASHPFKKGLPEKWRLHTFAKCIWSRPTWGLCLPLRTKTTLIVAFLKQKEKK